MSAAVLMACDVGPTSMSTLRLSLDRGVKRIMSLMTGWRPRVGLTNLMDHGIDFELSMVLRKYDQLSAIAIFGVDIMYTAGCAAELWSAFGHREPRGLLPLSLCYWYMHLRMLRSLSVDVAIWTTDRCHKYQ
ncbi:hypothetical protein ACJJTC_006741 [Scirpophaga incertulas]